jgi:single-strand DNA-binding protein
MNQTLLTGYLSSDVDTRTVGQPAKHLSKFQVVVHQKETAHFFPVVAWNMEYLSDHLRKGSRVAIVGSLRQETWKTKAGENRQQVIIVAYQIEFLDARSGDSGSGRSGEKADAA